MSILNDQKSVKDRMQDMDQEHHRLQAIELNRQIDYCQQEATRVLHEFEQNFPKKVQFNSIRCFTYVNHVLHNHYGSRMSEEDTLPEILPFPKNYRNDMKNTVKYNTNSGKIEYHDSRPIYINE